MGIVEDILAQKPEERATYKSTLIQKALAVVGEKYTFTLDGYTVTVTKPVLLKNGLQVNLDILYEGKPLDISNPVIFLNPPVKTEVSGVVKADLLASLKRHIVNCVSR